MGLVAVVAIAGAGVAAWQMKLIPASLMGGAPVAVPAAPTDAGMLPAPVDASVANLPATVDGAAVPTDPSKAPLPPVISNPVPLISVPPPVQPAAGSAPATAAVPAATAVPPAAVPPAGAASTGALVITVRQDSWVEVRPASGKALFSRLVKAGRIETVTVNGPVTLVVGNPSGVDATLRGTPVAMPATSAGKVARIPLK
jgi:cytoskeleton protein RodZ